MPGDVAVASGMLPGSEPNSRLSRTDPLPARVRHRSGRCGTTKHLSSHFGRLLNHIGRSWDQRVYRWRRRRRLVRQSYLDQETTSSPKSITRDGTRSAAYPSSSQLAWSMRRRGTASAKEARWCRRSDPPTTKAAVYNATPAAFRGRRPRRWLGREPEEPPVVTILPVRSGYRHTPIHQWSLRCVNLAVSCS
jgi:hypothetical protein